MRLVAWCVGRAFSITHDPASFTSPLLYSEIATRQLEEQLDRLDGFHARAVGILTIASTILPIGIGLQGLNHGGTDCISKSFQVTSVLAFLGVVGFSLHVLRPRNMSFRPNLSDLQLHNSSGRYTEARIQEWIGDECRRSVEANQQPLESVSTAIRNAMFALAVESFTLAISGLTAVW